MKSRLLCAIAVALCLGSNGIADTWEEIGNSNQAVRMAVKVMVVDSATNTLYVGGIPGVAKYDGTSWTTLGSLRMSAVQSLAVYKGVVYAGGSTVGSMSECLYKWNGTSWDPVTVSLCGPVTALFVYNNQLLEAGISYAVMSNPNTFGFAAWDGAAWSPFGGGYAGGNPTNAQTIKIFNGSMYAGGLASTLVGAQPSAFKKYNGTTAWEDASGGAGTNLYGIWSMDEYDGGIVVGGQFDGGKKVAMIKGGAWSVFQGGADSAVYAVQKFKNNLYVGGSFTHVGNVAANYVARWNGTAWEAIGTGMGTNQPYVFCMTVYNNRLIVGGQFTRADGKLIVDIARLVEGTTDAVSPIQASDNHAILVTSSLSSIRIMVPASIAAGPLVVTFNNAAGRKITDRVVMQGRSFVVDKQKIGKGIVFYSVMSGTTIVRSGRIVVY